MYYWHWLKNLLRRPHTTGYPTEPNVPAPGGTDNTNPIHVADSLNPASAIRRALAIRHVDAGSCNGCESELAMLSSPDYDFTRYGFSYTPSPKHADLLLVTGVITDPMVPVIEHVFQQMTAPKKVVAIGACAIDGGVFAKAPGIRASLAGIVPVTLEVAGCPPSPGDILRGLLWAVDGVDPLDNRKEGIR